MALWSKISERMGEQSGAVEMPKMSLWSEILRGCVNSFHRVSERMCERIGVIEVPKISRAGLESKRQLDEAELAFEATRTPATPLRQTSDNA